MLNEMMMVGEEDFLFFKRKFAEVAITSVGGDLVKVVLALNLLPGVAVSWCDKEEEGKGFLTLIVNGDEPEAFEYVLGIISSDELIFADQLKIEFKVTTLGKSKIRLPTWTLHWLSEAAFIALKEELLLCCQSFLRERKKCGVKNVMQI